MLEINKPVPDFSLPDQDNNLHSIKQYTGKKVLLFFYPKDNTPGCTIEACNFRDAFQDLLDQGVQVLSISKDNTKSKKKFAEKFNLPYPLLADEDKKVAELYGVLKEKSMFGKKYMGIQRDSFLIDESGKLLKHYIKVKPADHIAQVLKDIKSL